MKRLWAGLLAACLLLSLAACGGGEEDVETAWTPLQMARAILASQEAPPGMTELLPGDGTYEIYVADSYGLNPEDVADGAILAAGGASAQEIAVLRLTEQADSDGAADALRAYLEARTGDFTGYLPEEAALLEDGAVVARGDWLALLVCGDTAAAEEAFSACFTQVPPAETAEETAPQESAQPPAPDPTPAPTPTPVPAETEAPEPVPTATAPAVVPTPVPTAPPAEPWSYDEARLLAAWERGDWSGLAEEDRAILDVCAQVIADMVPADGSDYEKELAVHDWMVAHGSYDSNTLSQLPDFRENPNNDNPYGFLVDGKGICLGYASTFQLFMDLLGIQCITVQGTAHGGTSDHAWNQVCLDGDWYCVDVTWDDPTTYGTVSERTAHRYFNVTSGFLRDTDHQWEASGIPEAEGTAYPWRQR